MTIHKEVLEVAFKTQSNNERHRTVAETRYWCEQYKLLAKTAIEALAQSEQEPVAVYGHCPECGAKGVARERRPDGNDCCANGHTYPSRTANKTPQRTWVGLTEDEAVSSVSSVLPVTSTGGQTHYLQIQHKHALEITRTIEAKLKEKNT